MENLFGYTHPLPELLAYPKESMIFPCSVGAAQQNRQTEKSRSSTKAINTNHSAEPISETREIQFSLGFSLRGRNVSAAAWEVLRRWQLCEFTSGKLSREMKITLLLQAKLPRSCKVAERGVRGHINLGINEVARAAKGAQLDTWVGRWG